MLSPLFKRCFQIIFKEVYVWFQETLKTKWEKIENKEKDKYSRQMMTKKKAMWQ